MRAVVVRAFAPLDRIEIGELPEPAPGPGEVVIEVRAAEVNYPDILVIEGRYQVKPPLPFAPGKGAAGVVSAVGDGVSGIAVGDRVAAQVEYGAYAERLRAPACNVFPLPAGIDFVPAAALGLTYQTAYFALIERARLRAGESVLVLGASGGVGVAGVQLAKALGAGLVIAGVRAEEDAAIARQAGADAVVLVTGADLRDRLREQVRKLTGGGVDVVLDPVGGAPHAAALRALAWRGRLVVVGFAAGEIPQIPANYLLVRNIEVAGLQWSDYRDRAPAEVARVQAEIFALHLEGKLTPQVSRVLPLTRFREALGPLQRGEAQGKVILTPG